MAHHTHEFDCAICGAHLDTRQELDRHTAHRHPETIQASRGERRESSFKAWSSHVDEEKPS